MFILRDSQNKMADEIVKRSNLLISSPMGSGKTLATLTALDTLIFREGVRNVLIIAPKRVARSVWAQEARKYKLGLNCTFCDRALDFKFFLMEPTHHRVAVASVTKIDEIPHGCWDMVIVDESTLFGNKMAKRSREARRIMNRVPRRVLLTGTAVHRGYEKLWHQIFLLDGGAALGKSLTSFRSTYMRIKYQVNGVVTVWEINPDMLPILHNRVRDLVYVPEVDVKLPPVFYKNIFVDLPEKRMAEYKAFETTAVLQFREDIEAAYRESTEKTLTLHGSQAGMARDMASKIKYTHKDPYTDTKTLVAFAASSKGVKLRQLATGCVYADETNKTYSVTHREKIEALREIVETTEGGVLVAYQFISEYEELRKAFPMARRLDTAEDIAAWNRGEIKIVVSHAQSLGHGLNLQHGGSVVVWYSPTYDAEIYAQFNARLPRPGQTADAVSVLHLVSRGTIEEKMLTIVAQREHVAEKFNRI